MRVVLLLLVLSVHGFVSAASGQTGRPSNKGVVLSASAESAESACPMHTDADDYWTPSRVQVVEMEAKMESYVRQKSPPYHEGGIPSLHDSVRYYVGVVSHGRRLICVQGLERSIVREFGRMVGPLGIFDGGCSVWRLDYEPATGHFDHLACNGTAD